MKEIHCTTKTLRTRLILSRFRACRQPQILTMKVLATILRIRGAM